ncbi:hypothetical protein C1I98_27390 [Spongiactinospora gelatinilytica]|uniref:Fenitrothion hydrolase n=1 Tax=Spongiactinospora gelatinilytica TaxID=2666298 RepID=A0A2W2FE29_9ACTN|nr:hypothetical protein C1I98_27390 [Spongiactinospora gelatinilytica]
MILAHGIGGRADLPIPMWLALYTGAGAVLIAFFAVSVLRPRPRPRSASAGVSLPGVVRKAADARGFRLALRACGLAGFGLLLATAWLGVDDPAANPAPAWFYVWFWVGLIPAALLFGPIWRLVNPLRSLSALARRCLPKALRRDGPPERLGHLPAPAGMVAFLWLELASPHPGSPRAVALFVTVYAVAHTVGGAVYGPRWFDRADTFEVYSGLLATLAPLGRDPGGRLVLRTPAAGLRAGRADAGHTALALVVLGGTMYDGLSRLSLWIDLTRAVGRPAATLLGTAALGLVIALNFLAYRDALRLTRPCLRPSATAPDHQFTHSLVPLMVGYGVAHYFSFAVFEGQRGWLLATDPFGRGWDLLGVGGAGVDYTVLAPSLIVVVQIAAIVLGHIAGVVSAHDRALAVVRPGDLRTGQYPMLTLMVVYTGIGITLMSAG